jgi:gas vesicle protein
LNDLKLINEEVFIMFLRDLLALVSKEKRNRERVKAAQKFVVGMGVAAVGVVSGILFAPKSGKETREDLKKKVVNTAETIKDTVQKKVETVKDSTDHAAQEVRDTIKNVQGKTEDVKKDIKEGYQGVKRDIHKTVENISDDLKKPVM